MSNIKANLIALILLLPFTIQAKNLKLSPGYYINMQGDTIKCNIEYGDWNKNPTVLHATGPQGPVELRPEDIRGFGVYGYADYISANVTYYSEPVTGTNLPDNFSNAIETKWFFLKLISTGKFSLYQLETINRTVFFVSKYGSTPSELIYRTALRDNQIVEDLQFHNTLFTFFNEEGIGNKYDGRINRSTYNENDITALIKILNGNDNKVNAYSKNNSPAFEPFVSGGVGMYLFPSSFNSVYATNNKFSPALSPLIGIGLYYNLSPTTNKFSLGLSANYSSYSSNLSKAGVVGKFYSQNFWDTTNYTEHIHNSNAYITLDLFARYILNANSKIKFYVKGGFWYSFSITNAGFYSNYTSASYGERNGIQGGITNASGQEIIFKLSGSFGDILTGAGLKVGQNSLEICYNLPSFTGRYNGTSDRFKIGSFSFSYIYSFVFNQKHK